MSEIQKTISRYLRASAGTANHLSEHTLRCFVGMLETGEATKEDFRVAAGKSADWLVNEIETAKERFSGQQ